MWYDPNLLWILFGCTLLGLASGVMGAFAYLRKESLMGDTIAHAALPGICIAFMITGLKSLPVLFLGAIISGVIGTLCVNVITHYSKIKQDTALGIVLSLFFGFGIVLITQIQHSDYGNQSGLDKFLFGQAASMVPEDVYTIIGVCLFVLTLCFLFFKEFKLICFNPDFAKGLGWPVWHLTQLLLILNVITVVTGIQVIGVILISALLIIPGISARYWTNSLSKMLILSGVFGAASGLIGTLLSAGVSNLPTGPVSVLVAAGIFFLSWIKQLSVKQVRK